MRLLTLGLVPLLLTPLLTLTGDSCEGNPTPIPSASRLLVGAEVVTILPEVDGSTSYFDPIREAAPLALAPGDPGDYPGVFVEEWDVGSIAIGNGARYSHWVHDDIRAGAIAFTDRDHPEGKTLVLVTVDVYMLFRQDIQDVYDKVERRMGADAYADLDIVVSASHNHMGPDTSGLSGFMNDDYFDYLTSQIADAIIGAVDKRSPALLKMANSRYQFGLADSYAPYITDPSLNSLQVLDYENPDQVLATVVQWQNHPEDTLGFGDDVLATPEQAEYLKSVGECLSNDDGETCHVEGQFISAGFPGETVRHITAETGAPALYFTGPVGGLLAPLHAYVWETEGPTGIPAGDGFVIPEDADFIPKNFHKQEVNGNELGKRVLSDLAGGEIIADPPVRWRMDEFFGRLGNVVFRAGMVLSSTRKPLVIGKNPRDLWICPDGGPYNEESCEHDNFEDDPDPYLRAPIRRGDWGKTEVWYATIGPMSLLTAPAEVVSELTEGLPADFVEDPRNEYYVSDSNRHNNVAAEDYDTEGYVRQMMDGRYKWIFGLTQDQLGYMIPISNFRIGCVADVDILGGEAGLCKELFDLGIMDFEDYDGAGWSVGGERCREIRENPEVLNAAPYTLHPRGAEFGQLTCEYGQLFAQADGHYPETLSASHDLAQQWIDASRALIGFEGPLEDVNPEFIGHNDRD